MSWCSFHERGSFSLYGFVSCVSSSRQIHIQGCLSMLAIRFSVISMFLPSSAISLYVSLLVYDMKLDLCQVSLCICSIASFINLVISFSPTTFALTSLQVVHAAFYQEFDLK
jgi:hypothetical protein